MDLFDIAVARKLAGGGGGGGGSSDFSTATLTINGLGQVMGCFTMTAPMEPPFDCSYFMGMNGANNIILYKGAAAVQTNGAEAASISGNIQEMGDGAYLVSGDCTMNF